MDLKYIVKNFNPTPRKQKVDPVPTVKKEEIEDIQKGINYIMDTLDILSEQYNAEAAPDYVEASELNDKQLTQVRIYLHKVWTEHFSKYQLSKDMSQLFVWNIPKYIFKAADYCEMKMYPDALNPLFWFMLYCIEFDDPDDYCRLILKTIKLILDDPEISIMADELLDEDEQSSENNNKGED